MHTDRAVLGLLGAHYAPEQLAAVVARLLRVPEAWAALRNPAFLEEVLAARPGPELAASQLGSLSLGGSLSEPIGPASVEPHRDHADRAWQAAARNGYAKGDLFEATLLGLEWGRRYAEDADPDSLLEAATRRPEVWTGPLAIAWPALGDPDRLLARLAQAGHGARAIGLVLANLPEREAAGTLLRSSGWSLVGLLEDLLAAGEHRLAGWIPELAPGEFGISPVDPLAKLGGRSEPETTLRSLNEAWETAIASAALVADLTAVFAREQGDPVTELEALQRGLELKATPARRGRAALALKNLGRTAEALELLPRRAGSAEEQIARALLHGELQEEGADSLQANWPTIAEKAHLAGDWVEQLVEALWQSGDRAAALRAAAQQVQTFPANVAARDQYARMLAEAGDGLAASDQSAIALALAPGAQVSRRRLALILQELGQPAEALQQWKLLDREGTADLERLGECALQAGEADTARSAAARMIDQDPSSAGARLIEARLHALSGDLDSCRQKIEQAISAGGRQARPYLALAELETERGDEQAAGAALAKGAAADPQDAPTRIRLAEWLSKQGRLSEALEVAREARGLEPGSISALLVEADLLGRLGHWDEAVDLQRSGLRLKPLSAEVALALASALLQIGELEEAGRLAANVPPTATPEALLEAGRISVQAGLDHRAALKALTQAEAGGLEGPELDYWMGRGLESASRPEQAVSRYERALAHLTPTEFEPREAATLGLARSALASGQISRALTTLEQALEWFRGSGEILALIAETYLAAGVQEKASELARQAIAADPEAPTGWAALGRSLASQAQFESAAEALEHIARGDPKGIEAWLELAEAAFAAGDRAIGRRAAGAAAWGGRQRVGVLARVAGLLGRSGVEASAIRILNAGLRRLPENVELRTQLAELKATLGDHGGAMQEWLRASQVLPEDAAPLVQASRAAARLGDHPKSIKLLEQAVALAPQDEAAKLELARANLRTGRIEAGLAAYEAILEESPADANPLREALEAALLVGARDRVGDLIERAREVGLPPEVLGAAIGEAHLLNGRWDEAAQVLGQAAGTQESDLRTGSLWAMAISRRDAEAARQTLDRLSRLPCKTAHEAVCWSRALLRMLRWSEALEALSGWTGDPRVACEQIRLMLQLASLRWVLGAAEVHALSGSLDVGQLIGLAGQAIDRLAGQGVQQGWLEPLRSLQRAAQASLELAPSDPAAVPPLAQMAVGEPAPGQHLARAFGAVGGLPLPEWLAILEGLGHESDGDPAAARAAYRQAAQDPVIGPIGDFLLGRSYAAAGRSELASSHLNAAVGRWTAEPAWHHRLGLHYAGLSELDAALAHLQQAVELAGADGAYRLDLARVLRRSGQLALAEQAFAAALDTQPSSAAALREAGEVGLELGKLAQAASWFQRAQVLEPDDPRTLIGAARVASAQGDQKQARRLLTRADKQAPGSPELLMAEGELRGRAGELDSAVAALEQALEAGADPSTVRRVQSKLLMEQGATGRAIAAIEQALQLDPDDDALWYQLAQARETAGDWASADQAIREAVRRYPMNAEYRLLAGGISRSAGQLDRAIDDLTKAGELAPNDPRVLIETGRVYEARREAPRALEAYRKAIELDPSCLEALYRAGVLLRSLKAYRNAGELLKRAAELAPINQDVLHQLAAVRALELVHG